MLSTKRLSLPVFAGIVIGGTVLWCALWNTPGVAPALIGMLPGPPIAGQDGRITTRQPEAIVAVDVATYDEGLTGAHAGNTRRIQARLAEGRIFLVRKGTRVHILATVRKGGRYHVRILDGTHTGKTGYVPLGMVERWPGRIAEPLTTDPLPPALICSMRARRERWTLR